MPASELDSPLESATQTERRIFAIVSRPIPAGPDGKTIRQVVIFDNHPATLRLVMDPRGPFGRSKAAVRSGRLRFAAGAAGLLAVVVPMLWALL